MSDKKSLIHKTGLAVGLATFLISHANANPFQAEPLKTGYENTSGKNSTGPVTPHSYAGDSTNDLSTQQTAESIPHASEPVVASDSDTLSDYTPNIPEQNPEDAMDPNPTGETTDTVTDEESP